MEEPSVLDYIKAKLTFWKKTELTFPVPEEPDQSISDLERETARLDSPDMVDQVVPKEEFISQQPGIQSTAGEDSLTPQLAQVSAFPQPSELHEVESAPAIPGRFPWFSLAAILFGLIGQWTFEPSSTRSWVVGTIFYGIALVFLLVGWRRQEWNLPPIPQDTGKNFRLVLKAGWVAAAMMLAGISLVTFILPKPENKGMFTAFSAGLWLLAILLFLGAFWQRGRPFRLFGWKLTSGKIDWKWVLLLAAASGLVLFFRFYRLGQVPSEMVSDHAEKLLDVWDVLHGQTHVFFARNTGREAFQFYWTAAIILLFNTGYTFLSLKLGTVLAGTFALPFIYLMGKEIANRRAGLLAMVFAGIAYWPNVISRFGLRFPFYPMFVAPSIYFLVRGLKRRRINDFILSGVFLGIGLHGYTPVRVLPFVLVFAVLLYLLHRHSQGGRTDATMGLIILAMVAFVIFIPLLGYAVVDPQMFTYRTMTRLGTLERPLPGPAVAIFFQNLWNALRMFFWSDGEVWVHSIPFRSALDFVSAPLFLFGAVLVFIRYIRQRHWIDLFLLVSIPLFMLSSILSLAFPGENPSLNRTAGAIIPVFLILGLGVDGLLSGITRSLKAQAGRTAVWIAVVVLVGWAAINNYNLVFNKYADQFNQGAWNTSEMGKVIRSFADLTGSTKNAFVVGYPYWVDTRLVAIAAGDPTRDAAIWPDQFGETLADPRPKLFLLNLEDKAALEALESLYPNGSKWRYPSRIPSKDFIVYFVPRSPGEVQP